jgi:hypothetical protein
MDHVESHNDAIAQLLAVARSFAELTHRAMSDSEISLAAADMMGFAARQATKLLEEFIASHAQKAHNALAFAHTPLSAELDKAYADFECLMDAAGMIRLHGTGAGRDAAAACGSALTGQIPYGVAVATKVAPTS